MYRLPLDTIESSDSVNIMHIVLLILNVFVDTLGLNFCVGAVSNSPTINGSKHKQQQQQQQHVEAIFLAHFPYAVADHFDFADSAGVNGKKATQSGRQVSTHTINLLLCRLFSSSLTNLNEAHFLAICQYGLNALNECSSSSSNSSNNGDDNNNCGLSAPDIANIIKLAHRLFDKFAKSTGSTVSVLFCLLMFPVYIVH